MGVGCEGGLGVRGCCMCTCCSGAAVVGVSFVFIFFLFFRKPLHVICVDVDVDSVGAVLLCIDSVDDLVPGIDSAQ